LGAIGEVWRRGKGEGNKGDSLKLPDACLEITLMAGALQSSSVLSIPQVSFCCLGILLGLIHMEMFMNKTQEKAPSKPDHEWHRLEEVDIMILVPMPC